VRRQRSRARRASRWWRLSPAPSSARWPARPDGPSPGRETRRPGTPQCARAVRRAARTPRVAPYGGSECGCRSAGQGAPRRQKQPGWQAAVDARRCRRERCWAQARSPASMTAARRPQTSRLARPTKQENAMHKRQVDQIASAIVRNLGSAARGSPPRAESAGRWPVRWSASFRRPGVRQSLPRDASRRPSPAWWWLASAALGLGRLRRGGVR